MRFAVALACCCLLAGCSGDSDVNKTRDESKLSADLERRALSIEARADEAVAAAEREAAADLVRLNQEAATAMGDEAAAAADESTVPASPSK